MTSVSRALGSQYRPDAVASFLVGYHLALLVAAFSTLVAALVALLGLRSTADAPVAAGGGVPVPGRRPEVATVEGAE